MTFTYAPDTDLGKIRLYLGDTTEGHGVKPNGENFTDEEISEVMDMQDDHIQRTVAALCEILSVQFSSLVDTTVGPRVEELSQASEAYQARAQSLFETYGGGFSAFSVSFIRIDGYNADDLYSNVEVD